VGAIDFTTAEQEQLVVTTSPTTFDGTSGSFTGKGPATSEIAPAFSPWIPASPSAALAPENEGFRGFNSAESRVLAELEDVG
jgi:hypothetical protein